MTVQREQLVNCVNVGLVKASSRDRHLVLDFKLFFLKTKPKKTRFNQSADPGMRSGVKLKTNISPGLTAHISRPICSYWIITFAGRSFLRTGSSSSTATLELCSVLRKILNNSLAFRIVTVLQLRKCSFYFIIMSIIWLEINQIYYSLKLDKNIS